MKTLLLTLITLAFAIYLVPIVYAQRGYFAVGGEWILIIALPITINGLVSSIKNYRRVVR